MTRDRLIEVLETLAVHWAVSPRCIGQTTAMREGLDHFTGPCAVLGLTLPQAKSFFEGSFGALRVPVTPEDLPQRLRGSRIPLLADHYVMGRMLADAVHALRDLQAERDAGVEELKRLAVIVEYAQRRMGVGVK